MPKQKKSSEFSEDKANLEILKPEDDLRGALAKTGKNGNIVIGTLNIIAKPLKKRHEKHYRNSSFHLVADLILALIIVALMAMLVYIKLWQPQADVSLTSKILNPVVNSGELINAEIQYHSKEAIPDASLAMSWPENFVINSVEPQDIFNFNTNTFYLGDLRHGSNGKVKISGYVWGDINEAQAIISSLSCESCQGADVLNSLFYTIENSSLAYEFNLPDQVYADLEFNSLLTLSNNSDLEINGLELEVGSADLELMSSNYLMENNKIFIGSLAPSETVQVSLNFITKTKGVNNLEIKVFIQGDNQRALEQNVINKQIITTDLKLALDINLDREAINDSDNLNLLLNITNHEENDLRNIKFRVSSANSNFIATSDLVELETLARGASQEIKIPVEIRMKKATKNQSVPLKLNLMYDLINQTREYEFFSPALKVNSQLKIKSAGYYYSPQGDQLGIGPLPPTVDMPTSYWVFWEINNFGNELQDLSISAELPERVVWANEKSVLAGKLLNGVISNRVVWTVQKVADEGGNYRAGFKITLTPESQDLGQVMTLLKNINYSATDSFTGQKISGTLNNINTNLDKDQLSPEQGRVVDF